MRAFMSSQMDREDLVDRVWDWSETTLAIYRLDVRVKFMDQTLNERAEAEARMILAETEPTSWLFVPGTAEADRGRFVTSRRGSVGWFDETPFDALADALRAFVED